MTDFCRLYLPHIKADFLLFMKEVLSLWMIGKRSERDYSKCYTYSVIVTMRQYYQSYNFMWSSVRSTNQPSHSIWMSSHTWSGCRAANKANFFTDVHFNDANSGKTKQIQQMLHYMHVYFSIEVLSHQERKTFAERTEGRGEEEECVTLFISIMHYTETYNTLLTTYSTV